MKLIIAGATGFVATEIIRQSLSIPQITSVIALARRSVSPPSNPGKDADVSKLHSVVISDYEKYSDDVKKKFIGADACIWYSFWLSYILHLTAITTFSLSNRSNQSISRMLSDKAKNLYSGPSPSHPVNRVEFLSKMYAAYVTTLRSRDSMPSGKAVTAMAHKVALLSVFCT